MAADTAHRTVSAQRDGDGTFVLTNIRGGQLVVGNGSGEGFTPTELLLGAIGACTAIDVATLTARRAAPSEFRIQVDATKVRDDDGNRLTGIVVTFRTEYPQDAGGDAARELLPEAVRRSHDRLCTVGRTVELGTPISVEIR